MAVAGRAARFASGQQGRALAILGLVALAALVVASDLTLCPLALLARVPCPACGLTRASIALLQGHVARAVELHPLAPVVTPCVAVYVAARAGWRVARGVDAPFPWERPAHRVIGALAVAGAVVWVARFLGAVGGPVPV